MKTNTRFRKIITEIVDRILKGYEPKKVILFGSYAYGEPTEDGRQNLHIESFDRAQDRPEVG